MSEERLHFVDRLRGLAVLAMIEVHVVNALLKTELRSGFLFRTIDAFNGLVAPTFLFCAGLSAALGARKVREGARTRLEALRKAFRRFIELLAWGMALHASHLINALNATSPEETERALRLFYQCDILQVFAFATVLSFIVSAITDREDLFGAVCLLLGAEFFFAAPFRDLIAVDTLPLMIAPYINDEVPSPFPLAPWCGFFFFGAACVSALRRGTKGLAGAVGVLVFLFALAVRFADAFPPHDTYRAGPQLMIVRLALVFAFSAILNRRLAHTTGDKASSRFSRLLDLFARRSLFVYIVHIAIVYGRHPLSLRQLIGPTLSPIGCALTWVAVTAAMAALAHLREKWRPNNANRVAA